MSLLAWYKLDGNIKNSGISDHSLTTVTGVTTDGFSYQFDGTVNCDVHGPELTSSINHRSFSLCAWIKTPGLASGMSNNGILSIGYGLTLNSTDTYIGIRMDDRTSNTNGTTIGCNAAKIIIDNNWHNIVSTYDNMSKIIKIYCDGELLNTVSSVNNNIYYTNEVYIGRNPSSSKYCFNGSIRDVRIYDNCLSDVEVKDIAKGLILHYDFNEPFEPYTNLVYNDIMSYYNNYYYNNNVTVTKETLANETYKGAPIYRLHFTINNETGLTSSTATSETNILASFKNELRFHGINTYSKYTFKANTKYCYQIYWRAITHKKNMIVGGIASSIGIWTAIQSQKIDDEWNIAGEYKDGSDTSDKLDALFTSFKNTDFKVGEEIIIDFAAPMLVEGKTTFTDFSIYDASYDGTVYDVSGFNNDGLVSSQDTSPIFVKDDTAPSGSYALFDGVDDGINIPDTIILQNNYTIAFWVFVSINDEREIFFGNHDINPCFNIEKKSGGALRIYYNSGILDIASGNILYNSWNYIVVTIDKINSKIKGYINGTIIIDKSTDSSFEFKSFSTNFRIGRDLRTAANGGNTPLNGKISDFKIYSTALSADDILKLYKNRFEIDNTQKLLVNSIKENTVDNILYNGDFKHGAPNPSTNEILVTSEVFDNALELNGINESSIAGIAKINNKDLYEISFDYKIKSYSTDESIYIALRGLDSSKSNISKAYTFRYANTDTVLSKDLVSGDTTVEVSSTANWNSNTSSYQYSRAIGICSNFIWGYDRCTSRILYSSISGNIITLVSAYSGNTIPAGTKVANFTDGSTAIYIVNDSNNTTILRITSSTKLDKWNHVMITNINFQKVDDGVDSTYRSTRANKFLNYINFEIWCPSNDLLFANFKVRNVSNPQNLSMVSDTINLDKTQLLSSGNAYSSSEFSEVGIPIRYIRDSINGNTVNTINAWQEIEAFNDVGNNIAYNKKVKMTSESSFTLRACASGDLITTDPNYSNQSYISGEATTNPYIVMDLEFIEVVTKIKVWHYYNDGRTYHNHKIEVSADGTNWITVYDSDITGEVAETVDGIEVILDADKIHMFKQGQVSAHEFIER